MPLLSKAQIYTALKQKELSYRSGPLGKLYGTSTKNPFGCTYYKITIELIASITSFYLSAPWHISCLFGTPGYPKQLTHFGKKQLNKYHVELEDKLLRFLSEIVL